MHSLARQPTPFRLAPRCCARTRQGLECQSPAVSGKRRCRMHGGARGSGAPRGSRNGSYTLGLWTQEMQELRAEARAVIADSRKALRHLADR
ncbi:HGGxSTG domain-containing protein [Methylobacterium platani]|nr:HGGxSTG domain-containing protein [Methylobacterium platani]